MASLPFYADYDKRGVAKCKKCKQKLEKGMIRIARVVSNPFSEDGGDMKHWYHVDCLFETFKKARATTKKIDDPSDDIGGWEELTKEDQETLKKKIEDFKVGSERKPDKKNAPKIPDKKNAPKIPNLASSQASEIWMNKDDSFKEFRRLCAHVAEVSSYVSKSEIISKFFGEGSQGDTFKGDLRLWVRLLLPAVIKRVYNLQSKQLIKLFSQLFNANQEEMMTDLEKGDAAETLRVFFESSTTLTPCKKSVLTLKEVDLLLEELEGQTTEEAQTTVLKKTARQCTGNDLKMFIRLIKGDLRINAGAKHILDGIHPKAYEAFQTTRNLDSVMEQIEQSKTGVSGGGSLKIEAKLMIPVLPMLAEACKSLGKALAKCPNGMYAEIKYDGERVQIHKNGNDFKFFSRSLKPVLPHKVSHFKDFIPSAFPYADSLILDAEVLLVDNKTSLPLPFGTLGKHKKEAFKDATVCLFVFDCILYNGENLMERPIAERRKILEDNIKIIPNRIVLSEMKKVHKEEALQRLIQKVLSQGLEGLVLKDFKSVYEPGKRHWLKIKKDYLNEGAMADSADLVVLGAWYGTGKKGGMMSVFLMGCYDPESQKWCTVTKVHTGHDDASLERLQTELKMEKISQNFASVPRWLYCSRSLVPDFVAVDPKKSAIWEIAGAEFTQNKVHTADGISIRFPRVVKERKDKGWSDATDLTRLKELYRLSKEFSEMTGLHSDSDNDGDILASPKKKMKQTTLLETFSPEKGSLKKGSHAKKMEQNFLPDVFDGVKIYIPEELENSETLIRYLVAYGGESVGKGSKDVTHCLPGEQPPFHNIPSVSTDWILDSVKLLRLQPTKPYSC